MFFRLVGNQPVGAGTVGGRGQVSQHQKNNPQTAEGSGSLSGAGGKGKVMDADTICNNYRCVNVTSFDTKKSKFPHNFILNFKAEFCFKPKQYWAINCMKLFLLLRHLHHFTFVCYSFFFFFLL